MRRINIIVAIGQNNEIGCNNKLPWNIPEDLKRFKELTLNYPVIMGRKTFESIGKPLSNRLNIVISNNDNFSSKGIIKMNSLTNALKYIHQEEVFIIGGAQIYEQSIYLADKLYITRIFDTFEADTYFPKIDLKYWKLEQIESNTNKSTLSYTFENYIRKY